MSGHSKWSTIKHKKGALDAKRGKIFTKLSRAIMTAARQGGADPDMNADLRLAIDKAKGQNMPNDNIDRAIKRGAGDVDGAHYEQVTYEGYGPAGVAVFVEAMTDNRNRTVAELRHIFTRANGNLGQDGCVAWMFDSLGQIVLPAEGVDEDELLMAAVEGGADNLVREDEDFVVTCKPDRLMALKKALEAAGYTEITSAELTRVPQTTVDVEGDDAASVYRMLMALEDNDDVQQVFSNADLDDEVVAGLQ